jgi:membrane protein implicated in regulation of membrane protease activity
MTGLFFWLAVLAVIASVIFALAHSQMETRGWFGRRSTWIRQEAPALGVVTKPFVVDPLTGKATGVVLVSGELWTASCESPTLAQLLRVGDKVALERAAGLVLRVTSHYKGG